MIAGNLQRYWSELRTRAFGVKKASFSQEGEDRLLNRLLEVVGLSPRKHRGFFVDVGAHHPTRFSNTYVWYLRGWRGINIDARPGVKQLFDRQRPRDINLELGISQEAGELEFVLFKEPAYNTFDLAFAKEREQVSEIIGRVQVPTLPLRSVLDQHLPKNTTIDVLSVDVEGIDLAVLQSNDWTRYRPLIVFAEACDGDDLDVVSNTEICEFMRSQGYIPYSKLVNTLAFLRKDVLEKNRAA